MKELFNTTISKAAFLGFVMALLMILGFQNSYAQAEKATLTLTLEKARAMAIANNADLLVQNINFAISEKEVVKAKQAYIPNVYLDFNLQHNLLIAQTPVPAKAFNSNAAEDELLLLRFSTKWTGNTGINFNYDIYNAARKNVIKQSQIKTDIAKTDVELAQKEVVSTVSKSYFEALIARDQAYFSLANVANQTIINQMISEQYQAGRLTLLDLNKSKAELNLALSQNKEAQNIVEKSTAVLLYNLGFDPSETRIIVFEDSIETLFENYNFPTNNRQNSLNLKKLKQENLLLQEQKIAASFNNYPRLTFGGYYGNNYFDNQLDIFKDPKWHGNSYLKIGLIVPLSDWGSYKNEKSIADHYLKANELTSENNKNLLALNTLVFQKDIEFTKSNYLEMKKNFELEKENFKLQKQQFEEGRILIGDLSAANYAVQAVRNQYLNAAYNYLLAQLKLEEL